MRNPSRTPARFAALLPAFLALAACNDRGGPPTETVPPPPPRGTLAALTCEATPARGTVACTEVVPGTQGGASFEQRIVGGQGTYVRLATSGISYAGGVFSFNATIQNLSNLSLATADGATRAADGVRVFFHTPPTGAGGTITVDNPTGTGSFTGGGQAYYQYGGQIGGVDQGELGADGILASAETSSAKQWQFGVPASVASFSFTVYVSTQTPAGTLASVAPQVTSTSPATLVPGSTATLTGANFNATPGNNTVTIGGVAATVTGGSATQLQVTVPCIATGPADVQVTTGGMKGAPLGRTLQGNQRTVGLGQGVVVTDASQVACNEIVPSGTASTYVVAVYNTSTSPISTASFRVLADGAALAPAPAPGARRSAAAVRAPFRPLAPPATGDPALARARLADRAHHRVLELSRRENERLRALFRNDPRMRSPRFAVAPAPPPPTRTINIVNINGSSCSDFTTVNATRVYYSGKIAIYEDDATPAALKASANAAMQAYYNKIGDEYNADMEPIVRNNFGDPLRRDATLDNNGVLVALFTPHIANNFSGVAGFVISCDQYPNGAGNLGSNFGEYFYAVQPTVNGTGFGSDTPDQWYRTIRSTFIHETKHVASNSARVANGAAFEDSWLEEGTARHAEELWARESIYNAAWKGNTGYGSAATPGSIYCDVRPSVAACTATNSRRPSVNMYRHFSALYTVMENSELLSPFGASAYDDGGYFYAASWSLVRYAIDRYGASDAAFLGALTQSSSVGTANLAARAGVSIEQLLGGWALALYADDYPGLAVPSADLQIPTWNFDAIYAGLNADFPTGFTSPYPLAPPSYGLGSLAPVTVPEIVGGGASYFLLTGTHAQAQMLAVQSTGGGAPPSSLRVAVARVQ